MRAFVGVLMAAAMVAPSHADNLFAETHYELGYATIQDAGFGGGTASGGGFHLVEHNGLISRLPWLLSGIVVHPGVKVRGGMTTTTTESETEWRTPSGKVVDRTKTSGVSRTLSMTVEPLTAEEQAGLEEAGRAKAAVALLFMRITAHFDLMYLPNRDDGRVRGIRGALYSFAFGIGDHFEVAVGYAGARLKAEYDDPDTGRMRTIKYRLRSIAGRIGFAPARWLVTTVELMPNLLDLDDSDGRYGSLVRGTATVSIPRLDRFYGRIGAERIGLGESGRWSTFFEGGMRF